MTMLETDLDCGEDWDGERPETLQRWINEGSMWRSAGRCGRAMMAAIVAGHCLLGRRGVFDAYGNYIPSRHQVRAGTKGSFEYVAKRMGQEYAERMAGIVHSVADPHPPSRK